MGVYEKTKLTKGGLWSKKFADPWFSQRSQTQNTGGPLEVKSGQEFQVCPQICFINNLHACISTHISYIYDIYIHTYTHTYMLHIYTYDNI